MNENQNNQSNVLSLEPKLAEKQLDAFVEHTDQALDMVAEEVTPAEQTEYSETPVYEDDTPSTQVGESTDTESNANRLSIPKTMALGVGGAILAATALSQLMPSENVTEGYDNSAPSANYKVEAGDTLTGVASTVAENTPENETPTQAMEDITDRNVNVNANTQLSTEQILKLPSTADLNLKQPGVQLEKSE